MNWKRLYSARSYIGSSLWIIPVLALLLEVPFSWLVHAVDVRVTWKGLGLGLSGAEAVCHAVVTLSFSFIVFTFTSLLVAVQVASGQYTPRIIATTLLRDNVIRCAVGFFVFTYIFSVKALDRAADAEQTVTSVTGSLGMLNIATFLFLIDYAARLLRPVSLVYRVGEAGLGVLDDVYPESHAQSPKPATPASDPGPVTATILHGGRSATVLAVHIEALISEAERSGVVVEVAPHVGDFVGSGEPLFYIRGDGKVNERVLRGSIAFGSERTLEQDPLFAFRVLADIAIKALSKAINDPTTAVLAIDQLQRLLHRVGLRNLRTDRITSADGRLRVIFRTPNWVDFVHLACCEIRFYGSENIQVARRMRAMIIHLCETVPPSRQPVLREQLELLDREIERHFRYPADLALARIPDPQGLGTSTSRMESITA